jgi:ectoine hydroxylase-related dioxygenase (phytanoyl-CoA dioxygenase family)
MYQGNRRDPKRKKYLGIPVFSVLIALEDGGKFIYNPKSFTMDAISMVKPVYREEMIHLKKGTIVVFHPMLLHAGGGYGRSANTRLHFYILPKGCYLETQVDEDGGHYVSTYFAPGTKEVLKDIPPSKNMKRWTIQKG